MRNRGFIFLPILIILALISAAVYLGIKNGNIKITPEVPNITPTVSVTPTPTVKPTATPTVTSKPTPPPTPTQKAVSGPPGTGLSTITVATDKGNFKATVLSLDLAGTKMITDTANDSDCGNNCPVANLQSFVTKNGGFAGVNGTYFCPSTYAECSSKTNSFDFPVYNSRLGKWINEGNLFWDNRAIVYFDPTGAHYLQNAKSFSGGLSAGIVNYPGLVDSGNVQIDEAQSGLSDKQKAKGTKVGIGLRGSNNVMVVVAQNVNMYEFTFVFKSLGATGAMNLDTGGSVALYNGGRYVFGPGRDIPNAIIFAAK